MTSTADANGGTFGAFASAGYRFELGCVAFGPLAGLRYTHVHVDAYDESGAPGLDMHVDAQNADDLIASGGIAAAARLPVGSAWLTPYVQLTLEGDLLGDGETLTTALVTVPDVDRHLEIDPVGGAYGRLSGGLTLDFQPGLQLASTARRRSAGRGTMNTRCSGASPHDSSCAAPPRGRPPAPGAIAEPPAESWRRLQRKSTPGKGAEWAVVGLGIGFSLLRAENTGKSRCTILSKPQIVHHNPLIALQVPVQFPRRPNREFCDVSRE